MIMIMKKETRNCEAQTRLKTKQNEQYKQQQILIT